MPKLKTSVLIFLFFVLSFSLGAQAYINYAEGLQKSLYFYDAEKSGAGITGGRLEWRGDSEVTDGAIPLTPETTHLSEAFLAAHKEEFDPDGDGTIDLIGGFHDAGDHVKFGLPQSYTAATLGWGYYEFKEAFISTGEQEHMLELLKWFSDYFLRSTVKDREGNIVAFCYQVGDGDVDHDYWGPPELQEIDKFPRTAYFASSETPASDQCAGAAAALGIMYLNYRDIDPVYAEECLETAIGLYNFAVANRGLGYSGGFYKSSYDQDELSWAAVWLYLITEDEDYLDDIVHVDEEGFYTGWLGRIIVSTEDTWQNIWVHSWDTVWGGVFAKLAPITMNTHWWYIFRWNLEYWTGRGDCQVPHMDPRDSSFVATSPDGWSFLNSWGSARYNAAAQLCAMVYTKYARLQGDPNGGGAEDFLPWTQDQMRYIMGENPMGRSYIVGYSEDYARHPHHRAAHGSSTNSMDDPPEHKHTLWGALVGGPDMDDFHRDETSDYIYNEVAIDYNAGFVGALAGHVLEDYASGHLPAADFPPPEPPAVEFYTEAKLEQENEARSQITVTINSKTLHPPHWETGLMFRYFFNISELFQAGQSIDDVTLEVYYDEMVLGYGGEVTARGPLPWNEEAGIYYVEFDYTGYEIYGTRELHLGLIAGQDTAWKTHWDPANDWSREGIGEEKILTPHIPLYKDGILVYGEEAPKNDVTPAPSGGLTPSPTPAPRLDLKLQYRCDEATASSGQIRPNLKLFNTGTLGVPLEELTMRYYYTRDSDTEEEFNVDHADLGPEFITGTFYPEYVEIGFSSGAPFLGAGSNTGEMKLRINKIDFVPYNQLNDYSFDSSFTGFGDFEKITVYHNGLRIWGTPDGDDPTPPPTVTPTPQTLPVGDVNGSGGVDIVDALMTAQFYVGLNPPGFNENAADVNQDNSITIVDALVIAQYYVGLIPSLPL